MKCFFFKFNIKVKKNKIIESYYLIICFCLLFESGDLVSLKCIVGSLVRGKFRFLFVFNEIGYVF